MNTQATNVSESSQAFASPLSAWLRPVYWSVRRELWENRWIYIAPAVAAALFLVGFTVALIRFRVHLEGPLSLGELNTRHGDLAPALIMGTAIIVSAFYCLDAMYGERRDRSI